MTQATTSLHGKRMTLQEYFTETPEGHFELVDGIFREPPTPYTGHQRSSRNLGTILWNYVKDKKLGEVFTAPMGVVFDEMTVLEPDILFISKDRLHIITEKCIQGDPDLVVEIISPGSIHHDTVKKKSIYEKYGVKEYWIVNYYKKEIDVFVLQNNTYAPNQHCTGGNQIVKSVLLKEFKVELSEIFLQYNDF